MLFPNFIFHLQYLHREKVNVVIPIHAIKACRCGGIAPLIPIRGSRWGWVVRFTLPSTKEPPSSHLNGRLLRLQSRSGHFCRKGKTFPCPVMNSGSSSSWPNHNAHYAVPVPNVLDSHNVCSFWLPFQDECDYGTYSVEDCEILFIAQYWTARAYKFFKSVGATSEF
jgi:hypothetical protein